MGDKEHARRVEHANEYFGEGSTPGSQTERGRVYVSFGPPDEVNSHGAYEKWFYPRLPGVGNNVSFEFGLDGKPPNLHSRLDALRAQAEARQSELGALQLSLKELERLSAEERVKAYRGAEQAQRMLEMLENEIRRVEADLGRQRAAQAEKQR